MRWLRLLRSGGRDRPVNCLKNCYKVSFLNNKIANKLRKPFNRSPTGLHCPGGHKYGSGLDLTPLLQPGTMSLPDDPYNVFLVGAPCGAFPPPAPHPHHLKTGGCLGLLGGVWGGARALLSSFQAPPIFSALLRQCPASMVEINLKNTLC